LSIKISDGCWFRRLESSVSGLQMVKIVGRCSVGSVIQAPRDCDSVSMLVSPLVSISSFSESVSKTILFQS
jgi:hypothetical protein